MRLVLVYAVCILCGLASLLWVRGTKPEARMSLSQCQWLLLLK